MGKSSQNIRIREKAIKAIKDHLDLDEEALKNKKTHELLNLLRKKSKSFRRTCVICKKKINKSKMMKLYNHYGFPELNKKFHKILDKCNDCGTKKENEIQENGIQENEIQEIQKENNIPVNYHLINLFAVKFNSPNYDPIYFSIRDFLDQF